MTSATWLLFLCSGLKKIVIVQVRVVKYDVKVFYLAIVEGLISHNCHIETEIGILYHSYLHVRKPDFCICFVKSRLFGTFFGSVALKISPQKK